VIKHRTADSSDLSDSIGTLINISRIPRYRISRTEYRKMSRVINCFSTSDYCETEGNLRGGEGLGGIG